MFGMNIGKVGALVSRGGLSLDAQIAAIFATAVGAWYKPRDAAMRYQDSTGQSLTTTAGQPVGLQLDASQALAVGAEHVVNGSFSSASAWAMSGGSLITGGKLNFLATVTQRPYNSGGVLADRTKSHYFDVDFSKETSNFGLTPALFNSSGVLLSPVPALPRMDASGHYKIFLPAGIVSSNFFIGFNRSAPYTGTCSVDNVSITPLAGNHSTQTTATARPLYQTAPDRFVFDIDDVHVTMFPSALGSNCTVVRSVPGVGASILTGQTIGTSYSNTSTHSGLLIINRALTSGETAVVTAWANQMAGV